MRITLQGWIQDQAVSASPSERRERRWPRLPLPAGWVGEDFPEPSEPVPSSGTRRRPGLLLRAPGSLCLALLLLTREVEGRKIGGPKFSRLRLQQPGGLSTPRIPDPPSGGKLSGEEKWSSSPRSAWPGDFPGPRERGLFPSLITTLLPTATSFWEALEGESF